MVFLVKYVQKNSTICELKRGQKLLQVELSLFSYTSEQIIISSIRLFCNANFPANLIPTKTPAISRQTPLKNFLVENKNCGKIVNHHSSVHHVDPGKRVSASGPTFAVDPLDAFSCQLSQVLAGHFHCTFQPSSRINVLIKNQLGINRCYYKPQTIKHQT